MKGLNGLTYFVYQFDKLNEYLKEHKGMKLNAVVSLRVNNIFEEEQLVSAKTRSYTINNEDDLKKALNNMKPDIETRILEMALYQSGLMIVKVESIHIMYNKYNPTRAGQYIELPTWVKSKRACINIQNKDEKCFKYCVECAYHKKL